MKCSHCNYEHDGSPMRTDPRYNRVRSIMLADDFPRTKDGRFKLCHTCQRAVVWRGGYVLFLARIVRRESHRVKCRKLREAKEARRATR